jgi:hypothetical protein
MATKVYATFLKNWIIGPVMGMATHNQRGDIINLLLKKTKVGLKLTSFVFIYTSLNLCNEHAFSR